MNTAEARRLIRAEGYAAYTATPYWKNLRRGMVEIAGECCELCAAKGPWGLQVHHLSYERVGAEEFADLVVLCWSCHADVREFPGFAERLARFFAERPLRLPGEASA